MRTIKWRIYHCTADPEGVDHSLFYYDKMHREQRGFRKFGYHFLIHPDGRIDGTLEGTRTLQRIGAHVRSYNRFSIGIAYVGGLDKRSTRKNQIPKDTRTMAQVRSMRLLDKILESQFPDSKRRGHRDFSRDINGDGVITPNEWLKACPCFDVETNF